MKVGRGLLGKGRVQWEGNERIMWERENNQNFKQRFILELTCIYKELKANKARSRSMIKIFLNYHQKSLMCNNNNRDGVTKRVGELMNNQVLVSKFCRSSVQS